MEGYAAESGGFRGKGGAPASAVSGGKRRREAVATAVMACGARVEVLAPAFEDSAETWVRKHSNFLSLLHLLLPFLLAGCNALFTSIIHLVSL